MFLVGLVGVGLTILPSKSIEKKNEPKPQETQATPIIPTPQEFLKTEIRKQGLSDRDFLIMKEIIQCESSWAQFWERDYNGHKKGEVKVSNGNIGLAQINHGAHVAEYTKLNLDPYKEFDNLIYAVILYKRGGVTAWEKWSGHCWKPVLERQGIEL